MEETIKKILTDNMVNSEVLVEGSDAKFNVKIVSDIFLNKSIIDRHKVVVKEPSNSVSSIPKPNHIIKTKLISYNVYLSHNA